MAQLRNKGLLRTLKGDGDHDDRIGNGLILAVIVFLGFILIAFGRGLLGVPVLLFLLFLLPAAGFFFSFVYEKRDKLQRSKFNKEISVARSEFLSEKKF